MNSDKSTIDPAHGLPVLRHWGGFLLSGLIALSTDAAVLQIGTHVIGLNPLIARPFGILVAMVVGWLAHRRLTFSISARPTLAEFTRYSALAWMTASVNYAVFVIVLHVAPRTHPLVALVIASILATIFAYAGMRYGVFRGRR